MPTTVTGLLLLVVLLFPGFTYLVGKERHGTERKMSAFRETGVVVIASVTIELAVLLIFAVVRAAWPSGTPDVGALVRSGGSYIRGTATASGHYALVATWGLGMLALSAGIAYAASSPKLRRWVSRFTGPYPHESTVSAWWLLFETWQRQRDISIVCILDDGSSVLGQFGSFNQSADDSPDRDLILHPPIQYRPPGADDMIEYDVSAVSLSARNIITLFVNYSESQVPAAISSAPVALGEPAEV